MTVCAVQDCDRSAIARGWCNRHYQRWRKHGDPQVVLPKGMSAEYLASVRPHRDPTPITCGHPDRKHYAKGLCSPCYHTIRNKPWREKNRAKLALDARARVHGMRPQELRDLWAAQGGACANPRCDAVFDLEHPDHRNGLQIDHCHATGKVRGLLCKSCNTALGHINDDVERLRGLIAYLESLN